jgi:RNA polymerase sigma factor (sigma-70 family)
LNTETFDIGKTPAELIAQCKKGDHAAFKRLYLLYNKAMYNICVRMLNNKTDAEDVLQESFVSAFKNIGQFTGSSSFGAWLKSIVIHRCIDAIRKRNFNLVSLDGKDLPEAEEEEESEKYNVDDIKRAMALLPDGYRVILDLFLFEDFSHRMIAEKFGISEGTSKSQYSRGKKRLLELMKKNKPGHEG